MSRKLACTILLLICSLPILRANKITASGSVETYAAYIWRGAKQCNIHVAPSLTLEWNGLALSSYGFVSFDGDYREIDWDLSYTVGSFTFHLADYYARLSSYTTPENYFSFKKGHTNHIQEAIICYEPKTMPFSIKWFTFLNGDWIPEPDGTLGRRSFSSYLEGEVYHDFSSHSRLSLICGASVLKGVFTGYTKNFAVINTELRYTYNIDVKSIQIPITFSYIINPYEKTCLMNAGTGIRF